MHSCRYGRVVPASNREFWLAKRSATVERDSRKNLELSELGWKVMTVWECELRDEDALRKRIDSFVG